MTATIVHIHDQQGQIDAADKIIAEQSVALARAHHALLAAYRLNMPKALKSEIRTAIRVIEGRS